MLVLALHHVLLSYLQPRVGLCIIFILYLSILQQGGDAMFDFSFSELYSFLITVLGMILSFLAGRCSKSNNEK